MNRIILSLLILVLVGCATPITREEAQNLTYDCSDVDEKLAELIEEREQNNKRILNGVRSVVPVGVVINIIKGRYKENAAIATGDWAKVLDKKIDEMQAYKSQC